MGVNINSGRNGKNVESMCNTKKNQCTFFFLPGLLINLYSTLCETKTNKRNGMVEEL